MPLPSKRKGEKPKTFMSRCMSDDTMNSEYPDQSQRSAICSSRAIEHLGVIEAADFLMGCKSESDKKEEASFRYEHPKTGEIYNYSRKGIYKKDGVFLIYRGKAKE